MKNIYRNIQSSIIKGEKLLAVLIDPDKTYPKDLPEIIQKIKQSIATHIFVGGSTVEENATDELVSVIKKLTKLPILLFPGDITQITNKADGLLFLSLISGRNPAYLIGKHVESISKLKNTNLEVLPTGYMLIESGKKTAVEKQTTGTPSLQTFRAVAGRHSRPCLSKPLIQAKN